MNRIITYAVDEDGLVVSRVGDELAWPVLDFDAIGKGGDGYEPGDFHGPTRVHLEKFSLHGLHSSEYARLRWTKKIPIELKNAHREFWGFKPLVSS